MSAKQTIESFWSRVDVKGFDECWPWLGCTNTTGYGTAVWNQKLYCAHRLAAWTIDLVQAPEAPVNRKGTGFLLHTCDNKLCCNPTHWNVGTYTQNQNEAYERNLRIALRGQKHPMAKFTNEQAKYIRQRAADGAHKKELARVYNVSPRCISNIVEGMTYIC